MKVNIRERARKDEVVYEYYFNFKGQRYSKSGFPTKRKAEKAGEKVLVNLVVEFESHANNGNMYLENLIKEFFNINASKYSAQTLHGYKQVLKHIDETVLKFSIKDISYKVMQTFFNSRKNESINTNKKMCNLLTNVFKYAVDMNYIQCSPMVNISYAGCTKKQPKQNISFEQFKFILNDIEYHSKFQGIKRHSVMIAVKLGYYLGMRLGEVLALEKIDIDIKQQTLMINKTLVYRGVSKDNIYAKKGAKTEASNSTINIPDILMPDLIKWFDENPFDLVCPDYNGTYINPYTIHTYFQGKYNRHEYDFKFNFHLLRHSFATNLVNADIDPKTTQELMRHKSYTTTMDYYVHKKEQDKIDALNSVFSSQV